MQNLNLVVLSLLLLSIVFAALGAYLNATKANSVAIILLAIAVILKGLS